MAACFIAQLRIDDPAGCQDDLAGFMSIFDRHGGRLLTVSSNPIAVVEGSWTLDGVGLMEVPTLHAPRARKDDPDYVALAKIRKRTAQTYMMLVEWL